MTTLHVNGQKISENSYSYDKVDNITTINGNNYYYQRYTYDELNRLVRATGYDLSVVAERPCSYDMTMQYNNMSSPVQFTQMIATETATTSVDNTYHYDASVQPNAPRQIGDMYYTYDAAGNPTSILNSEGKGKDLRWDAENRLRSISDSQEGLHHAYAYDHTGERILKRYGSAQQASYNGKDVGTLFDFGESYSAYVSPYFVETNNGYTKHYYAGATRLVSKIGEGVYQDSTYISYGEEEKDQYFYFQDHLGSSTYITDQNGDIAQYAAYTPYGELFREYRNVTPYKFNGKELDAETGFYYYGARYYNPATALWLGVDPLASKYPSVSPYVYCVSNPIKYVDPDGRKIYLIHGTWSNPQTWEDIDGITDASYQFFNDSNLALNFTWSGGNSIAHRTEAANSLIEAISARIDSNNKEPITLVGHSHGGNVAIECLNKIVEMPEFDDVELNLITINTPVRDDYQLSEKAKKRVNHYNIYDPKDPIQIIGGNSIRFIGKIGEIGEAGRTYKNAKINIEVKNPQGFLNDYHNSHNRVEDWDY